MVVHGDWFAIYSMLGQPGTPKSAWCARGADQLTLLVAFGDCVRKVGRGGVPICPGEAIRGTRRTDQLTARSWMLVRAFIIARASIAVGGRVHACPGEVQPGDLVELTY
jgi:hypothetical protein